MGTCSSTGKASRRRSGGHGVSPRTNKNKNKSKGKAKNKKLEDDYTVGKLLGKGHYGSVFKGTSKATGKVVAVKMIDRAKSRAKRCGRRHTESVQQTLCTRPSRTHPHPHALTLSLQHAIVLVNFTLACIA